MALNCGIIGLTNVGKTTIFNCISNTKAEVSNYAFSAVKSNIGMCNVPDDRLIAIDAIIKSKRVVPATVEIVDVPGLAKGSSNGEGVGNKFLADIQQMDALIHVVRCFDDENLPHVEGSINPVRDVEIVDLELQVRDLDLVERKIIRTDKLARVGKDKKSQAELVVLTKVKDHLEDFQNVRNMDLQDHEWEMLKELYLLTIKPIIFVANVDDSSATTGNNYSEALTAFLEEQNIKPVIIAGQLESEITELESEEDRLEFLQDAQLTEPGVNKLLQMAYDQLNLRAFFTAGPMEVRAWTIRKGMTAQESAGTIHSDIERGFIRAEVMTTKDFLELGSEQAVKDAGKFRLEGKTYIVQDADILHVRFNV